MTPLEVLSESLVLALCLLCQEAAAFGKYLQPYSDKKRQVRKQRGKNGALSMTQGRKQPTEMVSIATTVMNVQYLHTYDSEVVLIKTVLPQFHTKFTLKISLPPLPFM